MTDTSVDRLVETFAQLTLEQQLDALTRLTPMMPDRYWIDKHASDLKTQGASEAGFTLEQIVARTLCEFGKKRRLLNGAILNEVDFLDRVLNVSPSWYARELATAIDAESWIRMVTDVKHPAGLGKSVIMSTAKCGTVPDITAFVGTTTYNSLTECFDCRLGLVFIGCKTSSSEYSTTDKTAGYVAPSRARHNRQSTNPLEMFSGLNDDLLRRRTQLIRGCAENNIGYLIRIHIVTPLGLPTERKKRVQSIITPEQQQKLSKAKMITRGTKRKTKLKITISNEDTGDKKTVALDTAATATATGSRPTRPDLKLRHVFVPGVLDRGFTEYSSGGSTWKPYEFEIHIDQRNMHLSPLIPAQVLDRVRACFIEKPTRTEPALKVIGTPPPPTTTTTTTTDAAITATKNDEWAGYTENGCVVC